MTPQTMTTNVLWTTEDVAKYTGLSVQHIHQLRSKGRGPAYVTLGRSVRYVPRRVIDWVATQSVETTDSRTTNGK